MILISSYDFRDYFTSGSTNEISFIDFLKKKVLECNDHYVGEIIECKLMTLEDSESLKGRIAILSRVIKGHTPHRVKLDILLAIRYRQCGIVRWMIENSLVDMSRDAKHASLSTGDFRFIKKVPSIPLGIFLCFAAVEYDDLSTLQWLYQSDNYDALLVDRHIDGMNLLHVASLLGRLEIVGWLYNTAIWSKLVSQTCTNDDLRGAYAAHIAAAQGHIHLTEMLLEIGCTEIDIRGRTTEYCAKKAPIVASVSFPRSYKFAHDWAKERLNEASLEPGE